MLFICFISEAATNQVFIGILETSAPHHYGFYLSGTPVKFLLINEETLCICRV